MEENRWLIFVILAITAVYALGQKTNLSKKRCIQAVTVILTCFSGFRSYQMGDVFHYAYAYQACNSPGWTLDLESGDTIGLQLFFHGAGSIGLDFQACLFIIAAFVAITLGMLIYKYSPSPFWSYAMYLGMGFYISSFNILKQIIAMGFIVLALICILENKPIRFVLLVAIASLFHLPSAIFLVAYPFAKKRIDTMYFVMVALTILLVFIFRDQIVEQASTLYYEGDMTFEITETIGGRTIMMVAILIFGLVMRPLRAYDRIYSQIFNVLVLAAIVQTFSVYDNVFSRLADYFYQFVVVFIPLMLQPGWEQAEQYPDHIGEIRCFTERSYRIIYIPIVAFTIAYYFMYINASSALLSGFTFFWRT